MERVRLQPGEAATRYFTVIPKRDLTYYDAASKAYAVDPGQYELQLGASSADIRLKGRLQRSGRTPRARRKLSAQAIQSRIAPGEALRGAGLVR